MATAGLATRCPICSTVFRVVPDQLRVSEGWVRCGRCSEVFNASLSLVDMDTGAPRPPPDGLPGAPAARWQGRSPVPSNPSNPGNPSTPAVVRYGAGRTAAPPPPPSPPPAPMPAPAENLAPDWPQHTDDEAAWMAAQPATYFDERTPERTAQPLPPVASPPPPAPPQAPPPLDPRAEPDDRPAFVQQADRAARWQRPRVRRALAGATAAAALALLLQAVYQYRELIAASSPALRPVLQTSCAVLGCRIHPAHAIDSLTVESSGLLRVEKTNTYSLSVGLRNRAGFEVALPALELSLTDSRGRLMARRVLNTRELGSAQNTVAAGSDVALQATLVMAAGAEPAAEVQGATQGIAGYTIELFYP